jgi:hypothetical protein
MITVDKIVSLTKEEIPAASKSLSSDDIRQLVTWLEEKDDTLRYQSLLLLKNRSENLDDVYPYWDIFAAKLSNPNSYQRSIGLMLLAENAKWDTADKFDLLVDSFLTHCDDEKPVTVRQCIQSLIKVVPYKKHLAEKIAEKLLSVNLYQRKETQRKILLIDILSVLAVIRKINNNKIIEGYIA